jgi:hypothetical protein
LIAFVRGLRKGEDSDKLRSSTTKQPNVSSLIAPLEQ